MLLRSLNVKNLVFIGFQATGKTKVLKDLCKKISYMPCYDIDQLIELIFRMPLCFFISYYGITYFRLMEQRIFIFLVNRNYEKIIATGAGFVLDEQNRYMASRYAFNILLSANIDCIISRVKESSRFRFMNNLTLEEELKNLFLERIFYYHSIKDYTYDTSKITLDVLIKDILHRFFIGYKG